MNITWLGHSCFYLETGKHTAIIDPFLSGNPCFSTARAPHLDQIDFILLTHGHGDHLGDALALAKKTGATVVAIFELAMYIIAQGIDEAHVIDMNIGGGVDLDGVRVTMVQATHSNSIMIGESYAYGGCPAGFIIAMDGEVVYHAGDTGVFGDMKIIQDLYKPTIGLLPIGDRYTMGPKEAAYACNELLDLKTIIPMHYGTFPALTGTVHAFKNLVKRGEVLTVKAGQGIEV